MSESISPASQIEGQAALRALDREYRALPSGVREVDRRTDSAYDIALLLVSREVLLVTVEPRDGGSLPFTLKVGREEAKDAYTHPFAYIDTHFSNAA